MAAQGGGKRLMTSESWQASLVDKIKEMQRTDEAAKLQWWAHCDSAGGGIRDPAKQTARFLEHFINEYEKGKLAYDVSAAENGGKVGFILADLFKEGQRKSKGFKNAWAEYCTHHGLLKDPNKTDMATITNFFDFLGRAGRSMMLGQPLDMTSMGKSGKGRGGMGGKAGMGKGCMGSMGGMAPPGLAPAAKRPTMGGDDAWGGKGRAAAYGKGGAAGWGPDDEKKDALVRQVKAFQRSSGEGKELWQRYCDAQYKGVRDPARHDIPSLQLFLSYHRPALEFRL